MLQIIEKAVHFAYIDSFYILPLIGSLQFLLISVLSKEKRLIYSSILLIILISIIFPFIKLIPNLGSDAFSELETFDLYEALFFIKTLNYFSGWSNKQFLLWFLIVIFYSIFLYVLFILSKKNYSFSFSKINFLLIAGLIIIPISSNLHKVSKLYNLSKISKENEAKNINYELSSIEVKSNQNENLSLIFYVGESTSRLNWSLYNYFRSTNKSLENFNDKHPLIIFDNIHSTHTHTSPSILDVLSIKANNDNILKIASDHIRYPLIDILNQASINTIIYSNQGKSGAWNLSSSLLFKNASKKIYNSKYNLGNADHLDTDKPYEHEFLEKFIKEIKTSSKKNNFYIFHSYAGHGNYKDNIPKEYHRKIDEFFQNKSNRAIFGKNFKNNQKKFLENYDSAMSYISDNITYSLKEISKINKPIIFVYTSDHGESPLSGSGHDSSRYIWEMSAVPFLIFFNEEAKLRYPKLFNDISLRANKENRDLLNNLPNLILEIFNLEVLNKDKDFGLNKVSTCIFGEADCVDKYHILRKQINSLGAVNFTFPVEDNYIRDNTDRSTTLWNIKNYLLNSDSEIEVCSHRTNSIARFIRFNEILNCMEIDLVIENSFLDVRHPPEKSTSLKLDDLIKIQKKSDNFLWLDIKNLNDNTKCSQLYNSLQKIYLQNTKIKFFLEFPSTIINNLDEMEECISNIKSMNFPMSYYISEDLRTVCTLEDKCNYLDQLLNKVYESKFFTDLSFDFKNYIFLSKSKNIDKFRLNTWHIPDNEIVSIKNSNFRLIIPYNGNINYN